MEKKKHILLDHIGKELPFAVPENYFEQFAQNIKVQISMKRISVNKLLKPWMYMAAMFVGILIAGQVFYTVYKNNTKGKEDNYESYVLSQVDESSIIDYYIDEQSVNK